jgi:hypothetical protein
MYRQTVNAQLDRQIDGQIDGCMNIQTKSGQTYGWTNRWADGQMGGREDRRIDEQTYGRTDKGTHKFNYILYEDYVERRLFWAVAQQ